LIKTLLQPKLPHITRGTAIRKNAALLLILVFSTSSLIIAAKPVSAAIPLENSWTSKAPMPSTLNYPKATMLNGKIYVVGVHYGENVNNSLFEYDPVNDNWTVRKSMPSSRLYFAVATCNNKIYVIGGGLNPQASYAPDALSTNEVYDPLTDTWETKASMPTARWDLVAETVNGKIYVISGRTGGGKTSVKVNEVYDPNTDSWTNASSIPTPVSGPASAVVDKRIYVIGGQAEFNDPMNPGLNQIYDPETDTWVQGAKEPNPAWGAAAAGATTGAIATKMIYVMGGVPGFAPPLDQNYAYDPKEDRWIIAASLPAPKSSFAVAVVNDLVYVIGGSTVNYGVITASVEQYTPIGYEMSAPPLLPTPSLSPIPSQELASTPETNQTEPFPKVLVIASLVTVVLVGIGLLVYFKRRKH
jgi:N-acetylneuraminic acid mutarotase